MRTNHAKMLGATLVFAIAGLLMVSAVFIFMKFTMHHLQSGSSLSSEVVFTNLGIHTRVWAFYLVPLGLATASLTMAIYAYLLDPWHD